MSKPSDTLTIVSSPRRDARVGEKATPVRQTLYLYKLVIPPWKEVVLSCSIKELMVGNKGKKEVKKTDYDTRSIIVNSPLSWADLAWELSGMKNPPEDVTRIGKNRWKIVFHNKNQARALAGTRWKLSQYTLLPQMFGATKLIEEVETRLKRVEGNLDQIFNALKVYNEHGI